MFIFIKNILIWSVRGSLASVNTSWVCWIIGFDPEPETRKPEPCPYIFYPAFSWVWPISAQICLLFTASFWSQPPGPNLVHGVLNKKAGVPVGVHVVLLCGAGSE